MLLENHVSGGLPVVLIFSIDNQTLPFIGIIQIISLTASEYRSHRIQAIYSPIKGENFVTVLLTTEIEVTRKIPVIILKYVISIVDYLYFRGQILL